MSGVLKSLENRLKRRLIARWFPNAFYMRQEGHCPCCEKDVVFESHHSWLRDHWKCSNCLSIPRERALMAVINAAYPNWRRLSVHESSPGNRGASVRLSKDCPGYVSSQFHPREAWGTVIKGSRNENLEAQTFPDASFDIVVTQDVMEHIYDPAKAFSEIARTLKPGGAHIFTVPIINKHKPTEVWATLGADGGPVFLKQPEYHSNPVDPKGSPVTMHWGFDIAGFIDRHSGLETTIEHLDDLRSGIRAEYIEVVVSRKPG